jgi:hypothetical protein
LSLICQTRARPPPLHQDCLKCGKRDTKVYWASIALPACVGAGGSLILLPAGVAAFPGRHIQNGCGTSLCPCSTCGGCPIFGCEDLTWVSEDRPKATQCLVAHLLRVEPAHHPPASPLELWKEHKVMLGEHSAVGVRRNRRGWKLDFAASRGSRPPGAA